VRAMVERTPRLLPRCPQPELCRPELSTKGPGCLAGFHRTLFPLVTSMGFPDNVGESGSNVAGILMAMGPTGLLSDPTAVTKEVSPAASNSNPDPVTPRPL
jgi:hypothetical protein